MIVDMHTHSTNTDGYPRPCEYAKWVVELRKRGYEIDGLILTEHDRYSPADFKDDFKRKYNVLVLRAVELNTRMGHLLLYGVQDNTFRTNGKNEIFESEDIIDWAVENDVVAVPAHPFSENNNTLWNLTLRDVRGIETIEGLNGAMSRKENEEAMRYAKKNNLKTIGGSDAHRRRQFGKYMTKFKCEITSLDDLVYELNHNDFYPINLNECIIN